MLDREVTQRVPIATLANASATDLSEAHLCSLRVWADQGYIAARQMMQTRYWGLRLGLFLASHATELYLKALIVSLSGRLEKKFAGGRKGHDLVALAEHVVSLGGPAELADPDNQEVLRRLAPMTTAGRYPNADFRSAGMEVTAFLDWLDGFASVARQWIQVDDACRDEIAEIRRGWDATDYVHERVRQEATRNAVFFQNKQFDGWWLTEEGIRASRDGTPWIP